MKNSIIFLYFLFLSTSVFAQTENLLISWDSKIYNPKDFGLTSLSCEARITGLTESLKTTLIIPNISNVFFRITWDPKNQFSVKLVGLPPGFNEIKNSLELTLVDKLRFFIPLKIYEGIQDYEIKANRSDSGTQYILEDKSYLKGITKIEVSFDTAKKLSKMDLSGTNFREINTFTYDEVQGTKKFFLKNFLVENVGAQGVFAMSYDVDYADVGKYYFPKKINITSQVQSLPGEKGQKQIYTNSKYQITFSNFLVK